MCNVNNEYIYSVGGENKYDSIMDIIERYNISVDFWEVMNIKLPVRIECTSTVQSGNEMLILGGYSYDYGLMNTVFAYDYINNSMRKCNINLLSNGWCIYQPIKQGNNIHVFFGGEEEFPPKHIVYTIN